MSVSNAAPSAVSPTEATPTLSRTNMILLVVLLAQIALSAFVFWPRTSASVSSGPLLTGVSADAATALTITDDNDRSVSFVKEDGVWTVADTDGYPANGDKISTTLNKLIAITGDRLVTRTAGSHGRLQVADDDYLRKVEITTDSGTQTLYLGSSAGASATHVRAADQEATYLTNEVATWELDTLTTTWIDVAYFKVPKDQITEVTLENANGTFTFVRSAESSDENPNQWTLADATADEPIASANINTLIDRVATLNLHSVLGKSESPDYALDTPLATLTVTTSATTTDTSESEVETTTLLVGAKDETTNTYILKSSASEFYVRLAAFTGDEFVNKQRSDFMIQGGEATGDSGSSSTTDPEAEPSPEATAPEVGATDVQTATSDIESSGVQTDTSELDEEDSAGESAEATAEPTVEPTVDATDVQTDTNAANEEAADATDEITSTVTPEPSPTATE